MAEDIIEDKGRLFKRVGNEEILYPADDQNFALREKKLLRTPKDYLAFSDIQRYTDNLNRAPSFKDGAVMLPDFKSSPVTLVNRRIYALSTPGFIYKQRTTDEYGSGFSVYIDGENRFSDGPMYHRTPDGFPDPSREYFIKSGSTYISAGKPGELTVFDPRVTYYEKYGRTYFLLYSTDNNGGPISNNLFPICPGTSNETYIAVDGMGNTESVAFVRAVGCTGNCSDILDKNKKYLTIPDLAFNKFDRHNARCIFARWR